MILFKQNYILYIFIYVFTKLKFKLIFIFLDNKNLILKGTIIYA